MSYELLSTLPPGAASRTRLAVRDGRRKVVLRQVRDGVEPFLPETTPEAVLPLIEISEQQGVRYAVYDYVPGVTLRELVEALREQDQPVPLGLVGRVVVDGARAIGQVHGTHPPLPPHGGLSDASLYVGFDGGVRVLDYGVPRASRFQPSVQGGPHGDVFALGAVLHSVLTDFAGSYADAVDDGVPLPPPTQLHDEATPALDDVVARATSRAFARRHIDAGSLADELEAVLGDSLYTSAQVAELVGRLFSMRAGGAARAVQLEPDEAALGDDDNAPTGAHQAPWLKHDSTHPSLEPVGSPSAAKAPAVPWVTGTTGDDFPPAPGPSAPRRGSSAPPPAIPSGTEPGRPSPGPARAIASGTEPGRPSPALADAIPSGTEPGRAGPFAASARGAEGAAPPGLGDDDGALGAARPRATATGPEDAEAPRESGPRPSAARARAVTAPDAAKTPPGPTPRPSAARARPSRAAAEPPAPSSDSEQPPAARDTADEDASPPPDEPEPTRPRASVPPPRRSAAPPPPAGAAEEAPALGDGEPEPTRPRARLPIAAQDTNPRVTGVENLDTHPRASAPRPRNTTEYERLKARGQERISTPPVGVPAVDGSEEDLDHGVVNEPTNVRPRPGREKPPPPASEGHLGPTGEAERPPNRARPLIAGLLLLLALGFGAVALFAPQKLAALKVRLGLAPAPTEAPQDVPEDVEEVPVDAGEAAAPDTDAGGVAMVATADELDGGDEGEDDDGGEDDGGEEDGDSDAGHPVGDAGVSDGGVPDGGALQDAGGAKPELKSPPKKKKKKRRRRR